MCENDAAMRSLIVEAYFELKTMLKRPPTPVELCKKTGVSHDEFNRLAVHITPEDEAVLGKLMTVSVIGGLAEKAVQGDAKAVELFFKHIWGTLGASKSNPAPTLLFPDGGAL